MGKLVTLTLLLMICSASIAYSPAMIELGRGFHVPELAEISSIEPHNLNCQTEGLL